MLLISPTHTPLSHSHSLISLTHSLTHSVSLCVSRSLTLSHSLSLTVSHTLSHSIVSNLLCIQFEWRAVETVIKHSRQLQQEQVRAQQAIRDRVRPTYIPVCPSLSVYLFLSLLCSLSLYVSLFHSLTLSLSHTLTHTGVRISTQQGAS